MSTPAPLIEDFVDPLRGASGCLIALLAAVTGHDDLVDGPLTRQRRRRHLRASLAVVEACRPAAFPAVAPHRPKIVAG